MPYKQRSSCAKASRSVYRVRAKYPRTVFAMSATSTPVLFSQASGSVHVQCPRFRESNLPSTTLSVGCCFQEQGYTGCHE